LRRSTGERGFLLLRGGKSKPPGAKTVSSLLYSEPWDWRARETFLERKKERKRGYSSPVDFRKGRGRRLYFLWKKVGLLSPRREHKSVKEGRKERFIPENRILLSL